MYRWYVINTRSNLEKKVKEKLERRLAAHGQAGNVRQIVIQEDTEIEIKDGEKIEKKKKTLPGYILINMNLNMVANPELWTVIKETQDLTGFVGASTDPMPLTQGEVDKLLHNEVAQKVASKAQFTIGESVKVVAGPMSDFSGEIAEINQDAAKLKVLVSIFGRETPVEVAFDQVKKI